METVDIIITIVLVLGAIEGYRKGFLMSVLGLFGFIIGIILGFYFMDTTADWLADNVKEFNIGYPLFAFFLIFITSMLLVRFVGWMLKKTLEMVLLGSLDKAAGLMLGVVKAAVFISLFIWLANLFDLDLPKKWKRQSETLAYIEPIVPALVDILEPALPFVEQANKKIEDLVKEVKILKPKED